MCGIAAVSGIPDAAKLVFLSLYSLQHRGQEAAGIVAIDEDGEALIHKDTGLVSDTFKPQVLAALAGETALGHIRYSTAGGAGLMNAQPLLVRYAAGDLA